MEQLRLAITISGAVSLGAYEGGALAALLVAVQELLKDEYPAIRVDAIGGASAGSITGLLTARTLLAGLDPIHVMQESWVTQPSLDNMRTSDSHAPLSVDRMRAEAVKLLEPSQEFRGRPKQNCDVMVHMALASLRGATYRLARLHGDPILASTNLDWGTFTFRPDMKAGEYVSPEGASAIDFALASGANAFGFSPKVLNRRVRQEDLEQLQKGEIIDLPKDWGGWLWYTDGGTIDNEPLGQTLDLANELDKEGVVAKRLHLLIHPHPTAPPLDDQWANHGRRPRWLSALARADRIQRTQSLYEDLRRVEKTNSRLDWNNRFRSALEALLQKDRDAWSLALVPLLEKITAEKIAIKAKVSNAIEATPVSLELSPEAALTELLELITGLGGKEPVGVDVVSPLTLPESRTSPVEELLAGEFLGHFAGFLEERLRMSDFVLGYRSMLEWLPRLSRYGLSPGLTDRAVRAASDAYGSDWDDYSFGEKVFQTLVFRARLKFYRVVLHVSRVIAWELIKRTKP